MAKTQEIPVKCSLSLKLFFLADTMVTGFH